MKNKDLSGLIRSMLDEKTWAVVGASANPGKFGYKVFKKLAREGYKAYPVNPNCGEIDGTKCYAALGDLPETPGAVSVIVPPVLGLAMLEEASGLGIKAVVSTGHRKR